MRARVKTGRGRSAVRPYSYRIFPNCNQPLGEHFLPRYFGHIDGGPRHRTSLGDKRLDGSGRAGHMALMSMIKAVCVYCGSGPGNNPKFVDAAQKLGRNLAQNDIRLIYGGGSIGLMGAIAESVVDHGGAVTGIIPDFLKARELMFRRAQEMIVTRDMHERKRLMFERADAFVALPGGIGTLEELVEQLTWAQLGRHQKPILIANIDHFWDPFCTLLDHMRTMQFIRAGLTVTPLVVDRVEDIVPALRHASQRTAEGSTEMTAVAPEKL
jgi:uncharacterized protein (TIGR00730 family)